MNPAKCAFRVVSRNLLGFMVHNKGIEMDSNKTKAIINARAPENLKQLQGFLGQVNFLRRFVSNVAAVKGQIVANFLADHPSSVSDQADDRMEAVISPIPWILKFDGSSMQTNVGARVFIESPWGKKWTVARPLALGFTNNQAEYEALLVGLRILLKKGAKAIRVQGDSQLILKQITGEFQCKDEILRSLRIEAVTMLQNFDNAIVEFIPRAENEVANDLAQEASGYKSSAIGNFKSRRVCLCPVKVGDWRMELRKAADGMLLKCVDTQEAMKVMGEVHEGVCGAHRSGLVMRWMIRRYGYFWPLMTEDFIKYAQGCEACQQHGPLIRISVEEMHAVVKPWPFWGWVMDIIGKIHLLSSKRHSFILVATDYFTKWIEVVPLANNPTDDYLRSRYCFYSDRVAAFAAQYGIALLHSSPYYAQVNGQAEAANKVLIGELKRPWKITREDDTNYWLHSIPTGLWAKNDIAIGNHGAIVTSVEVEFIQSRAVRYNYVQRLEDVHEDRMMALENIRANKVKVARAYNKKIDEY
ncbi:uncharacterized protein LOC127258485 [Andrographis paniculata]|uniref:uncharacterized protein LOC127258485 n=1 Tax=Andrographis paniculata TaxID=175694 RepID=UPI0021E78DA1|nr:uncharacterized protein LOC127258485 [Andrographis paniculata]